MDVQTKTRLDRKWKKHADEMELEVIQKLKGNSDYHVLEVVRASLKRFGVEKAGLRRDSFVMRIEAAAGTDEGRRSASGWLCFESEPDAVFYLFHVWLRHVKTNFNALDDAMADTVDLVEKAMGIAVREGGFGNEVLRDMIIRAIGRLASVSFAAGVCLDGGEIESELLEGCSRGDGRHDELAKLAATGALDVQNRKHLKMLEAWMAARQGQP
ncbi:MAG TPA: hypothetical protein PKN59_07210 [Syntrophales bacterium]|nr:hypothetical protein [Syntrophales bacterium]